MDIASCIKTLDADHCIGTWHETQFHVFWGSLTLPNIEAMTRIRREHLAAQRRPSTLLIIVEQDSPIPNSSAVREFGKFSHEVAAKMAVAVGIAEGGGFRAATMRSVAATLAMIMPGRMPYKFVPSVEDAAPLLTPHLSPASRGFRRLADVIAEVRAYARSRR